MPSGLRFEMASKALPCSAIFSPGSYLREDSAAESPWTEYHLRYAILVPLPALRRKRGNPNWRRPTAPARALATEFELRVRQLKLTAEMYASSLELRTWCKQNRNRYYVPEWLLAEWCITVDPYFSGESEYPRVTQFARPCHRTRTVGSV